MPNLHKCKERITFDRQKQSKAMNAMLERYLLELPEGKKASLLEELKTESSSSYLPLKQLFEQSLNLNEIKHGNGIS